MRWDLTFVIKSLLAGFMIGLGCLVYVVCPNRYAGAFLFSLGLLTVILKEFNLYTGKVGYISRSSAPFLLPMFLLNALGIALVGYAASLTRLPLEGVQPLVSTKMHDGFVSLFLLSIGCGVMMHLAVDNFRKNRHPLLVIMPIMFFILCGFEHCVANVGYWAMARFPVSDGMAARLAVMVLGNAAGSWLANPSLLAFYDRKY